MKLKLLLSTSLLYSISALAQNSTATIIYRDSLYKQTTDSNYKYKEIISDRIPGAGYEVKTYYKSGKLHSKGISAASNTIWYVGTTKYYYENGQLECIIKRSDIDFSKNIIRWHENGQKKSKTKSYHDKETHEYIFRVFKAWDKDGNQLVKNGNGIYEELVDGIYSKGAFKKSYKHGVWTVYDKENNSTHRESYKKGKLVSGITVQAD